MKLRFQKFNQRGFDHVLLALAFVVVMALGGTYYLLSQSNAATPWSGALKVNMAGTNLCMENMDNSTTAYTSLILNTCSSSKQAQHFAIKPITGSNFQVVAAASGACLDDPAGKVGSNASNRVYAETWPCSTSDTAQVWHWGGAGNHQLVNVRSGGCINDPASSTAAGTVNTRLIVFSCSGGAGGNAQWLEVANTGTGTTTGTGSGSGSGGSSPSSNYKVAGIKATHSTAATAALESYIVNASGSHICAEDYNGGTANNNKVDVYQCNGSGAQTWTHNTNKAGQEYYTIAGKCLEVSKNGTANGTLVGIYTCNGDSGQFWKSVPNNSKGGLTLQNPHSGKCLDDKGYSSTNGTQLEIYTCNGGYNQVWVPVTPATSSKK